ncbi:MAG: glycosyl hydrolase [Polyangia bacterium]
MSNRFNSGELARALRLGIVLLAASCANAGSGDGTGTGGTVSGTGGAATGGSVGTGGSTATGGTTATGGSRATGGTTATGGTNATGGVVGTGGRSSTGGSGGPAGAMGTGGSVVATGGAGGGMSGATGGSGGASTSACGVVPVDPQATSQAKNLLCYLYSIYGKSVLSGQQETSWSNPAGDISFYTSNVGKEPAILGGDYLYPSGTSSRALAYWNAGGLTMIRYHMGAPPNADTYDNSMLGFSSTQCDNVIKSGTSENTSFLSKLNYVATEVGTLQTGHAAVILALFHETQANGWFWWSKCSSSQFIALYKYTYNYLLNTKGLHNLVRLMPYSGSPTGSYFPGKDSVDISGGDTYGSNVPFTGLYASMRTIAGTTMPLALHETGKVPQPSTMFPSAAPWLLWNIWAGYQTSSNSVSDIKSAYSSSYTITRDEIPNLK